MCKMRVVVRREMLGAREQGWSLWTGKDVQELTSKQIKDIIKLGKEKICGLKIGESGELEMDEAGFFTKNIMEHRLCGNYQPMSAEDSMVNMMYTVIGSHSEKGAVVYDCISSRFEQAKLSVEEVKAYIKIGVISSGARLNKDGEIEVASLEYEKTVKTEKTEPVVENPMDEHVVSVEIEKVKTTGKAKK